MFSEKSNDLGRYISVDVKSLITEIIENNLSTWILKIPLITMYDLLRKVAFRCAEINDPRLNELMLRLDLYDVPKNERTTLIDQMVEEQKKMSFAKESENLVQKLINAEYLNACQQYGETYTDIEEMHEVFDEEIQEVFCEIKALLSLTPLIKHYIATKDFKYLERVENVAKNGIKELAQVGAVLQKIKNTLEKQNEN